MNIADIDDGEIDINFVQTNNYKYNKEEHHTALTQHPTTFIKTKTLEGMGQDAYTQTNRERSKLNTGEYNK